MTTESQQITFDDWCLALDKAAEARGYCNKSYVEMTGIEWWRDYYVSCYSPEEALFARRSIIRRR